MVELTRLYWAVVQLQSDGDVHKYDPRRLASERERWQFSGTCLDALRAMGLTKEMIIQRLDYLESAGN